MKRRWRKVSVNPDLVVNILTSGSVWSALMEHGLPPGCKLAYAYYHEQSAPDSKLTLVFEHEDFDEVSEAEVLPEQWVSARDTGVSWVRDYSRAGAPAQPTATASLTLYGPRRFQLTGAGRRS